MASTTPAPTRHLPTRHNPLMVENPPAYVDLVSRRHLGQTQLTPRMVPTMATVASDSSSLPVFDYAHLRAPLPRGIVSGIFKISPSSYFLMRRSQDGFVSATGMFKATFPYASAEEEEMERRYIKSLPTTSPEETAGNVWIPPKEALVLAEEYRILPWIEALLDPADISLTSGADGSPPKDIKAPPKFFTGRLGPPSPNTLPRPLRSRRSVSPTKSASNRRSPIKQRAARKAPQSSRASHASTVETPTSSAQHSAAPSLTNGDIPVLTPASSVIKIESIDDEVKVEKVANEPAVVPAPVEEEPKSKLYIEQDVKVDETGEKVTHTTVEVESPLAGEPPSAEETARMVAEAKEMIKAATEGITASAASPPTASPAGKKSKRKADEIEADEEANKENPESVVSEQPKTKKTKTEVDLKKERIKKRAFIGISATIAVGALIPYVMGVL